MKCSFEEILNKFDANFAENEFQSEAEERFQRTDNRGIQRIAFRTATGGQQSGRTRGRPLGTQVLAVCAESDRNLTPFLPFLSSRLVVEALVDVNGDRKCFRMIGGVLVERTVAEVLPSLQKNKELVRDVIIGEELCEN
jgi:hypothetical protein